MPNNDYDQNKPAATETATADTTEEKKSTLTAEKLAEILAEPLAQIENYWRPYKDKYQRLENLYFGNLRDDSPAKTLQSQHSGGEAFELVETILPRLIASRFGVDLIGTEESDESAAHLNEQILDWQIETQWLEQKLEAWIRQAAKTLGALQVDCEVVPVKQYRKKHKYTMTLPIVNKEFGVGEMVETVEVKKIFKHILETISWEDLIVSPGTDADTLPLIGKKVRKRVRDLTAEKGYDMTAVNKIKEIVVKSLSDDEYKGERNDQQGLNWALLDPVILDKEVELQELYCSYDGETYKVERHEEATVIIKHEPLENWHGMLPIRLLSLIPVENQSIGLSPLETAEGQIDSMDTWFNVMLETALFDVMRPTAYDTKSMVLNWRTKPPVYKPGMNIPVKGNPNNAFAVLAAPKLDGSHQWIANYLRQRFQNKTGVTDYITGGNEANAGQTLGEIQLKTAQSQKRFALNVKHIRHEMSKVMFMMVSNNQQYMPDDYPVRILGKRGYEYKKAKSEAIQGSFDFRVRGFESIATEEAEIIAKHRAMLQDAANPMVRPFVNIFAVVKDLFEQGYKVGTASKYLISPQERMQDEDQKKQAQAMDADSENKDPQTAVVRPDDDHAVHLDVHMTFIKSAEFQALPLPLQTMLGRHVDAHRKLLGANGGQNGSPQATGGATSGGNAIQPSLPVSDLVPPSERDFRR